ncbi:roadblock/LC7 domain-containing protein [Streptomyces malaysiensis]|uniref:Roadblock/LC7 family protein n=1 Tax=Streptomyces malaysiensis TaxID=92644 RepID=A0A7X6AXP6_STRMQ|nr:roadblock/LC7 domain-containing protein [Streptomyces malaysiensis]NIY65511.1 Roadblock/LC7 family protein [Streptomyces malaysiensis]
MHRNNLDWILDEHILNLDGTKRALLLSGDGLTMASSQGIDRAMAERMSAAVSGLQSLSRGSAEFANCEDSPWQQTMIEYGGGYIFLMAAGEGAYLAVSAAEGADVELVSYAMEKTIARLGQEMGVASRGTAGAVS